MFNGPLFLKRNTRRIFQLCNLDNLHLPGQGLSFNATARPRGQACKTRKGSDSNFALCFRDADQMEALQIICASPQMHFGKLLFDARRSASRWLLGVPLSVYCTWTQASILAFTLQLLRLLLHMLQAWRGFQGTTSGSQCWEPQL